jgi:hypothetical protein
VVGVLSFRLDGVGAGVGFAKDVLVNEGEKR